MSRIFCFIGLCLFLTACGKDERALPQVCKDLFDNIETLNMKAETNPNVTATLAENVKRGNIRRLKDTKTSLFKTTDINIQTNNCKILLMGYQSVINKLDQAKIKEEAEEALFQFK